MTAAPVDRQNERLCQRTKVFLPCRLRAGNKDVRVHLLDVSATGARVASAAPPPPINATVHLVHAGLCVRATVMWRAPTRFGLRFATELTPDQLLEWQSLPG